MIKRIRHTVKVGALMTVAATGLLVAGASPALADTSEATANALTIELAGNPLISTGQCVVTHPSDASAPDVCNENPTVPVLSALAIGLLAQTAIANPGEGADLSPATSAACAGAVAGNGTIQLLSPSGDCEVSPGDPDGVIIDLGSVAQIRADAIIAECTATSVPQGGTTDVTLVNAELQLLALGLPVGPPIPLDSDPAPNTPVVALGGLLTIMLNQQPPAPPAPDPLPAGAVGTTALNVELLGVLGGAPLVQVTVGTVTCGPNVFVAAIPVIPLEGLPIALATVTAAGVVALVVHRRRRLGSDTTA